MRQLGTRICLAFTGIAGALMAAELLLRLFPQERRHSSLSERPHLYYLPSDAKSLRGNSPLPPASAEEFRVAAIGDSFTFGPELQFDDTFPFRLQRMLNLNQGGRKARVTNYGTPGFATHHEVSLLFKALRDGADLVLLGITLNDPELEPLRELPRGFAITEWENSGTAGWTRHLNHSKLVRLVRQRLHNARSVTYYVSYHRNLFDNPETWDLFRKSIVKMKLRTTKAGMPFVGVIFPLFDFPLDEQYPFAEIHEKIGGLFRELGLPLLDLLHRFQGLDPARLQLTPGVNSHPNEIAHRIAADAIYHWLAKNQFIPAELVIRKQYHRREGVNRELRKKEKLVAVQPKL